MKKYFILFFLITIYCNLSSQNDIQFSQYIFNELSFNPSFAGNHKSLDACLIARNQWNGFDLAPSSQLFSVNTYYDKIKGGVGLTLINDKLGYERNVNAKLMYAFHQRLGQNFRISLGAGLGILSKTIEGSKLIYDDMTDTKALLTDKTLSAADLDIGLQLVAYKKLTLGLSSTHLQQSNESTNTLKTIRHYYAYAKYLIIPAEKIKIIPSLLMKSTTFINQFDINCTGFYDNIYWLGLSYRTKDAFVIMLGLNVWKNLRFGYSYDMNSGVLKNNSNGSHEIMLSYSFKDINKHPVPIKSPRFFN